jgi:hypothetical protein
MENAFRTHWIKGWVDTTVLLGAVENRNVSCPCRDSNRNRAAHSLSIYLLRYSGSLHALEWNVKEMKKIKIIEYLIDIERNF